MKSQTHAAGLVFRFFKLGGGIGIGDDASADMIVQMTVLVDESADGDVELGFVIESQEAHSAGVKAAGNGFEFRDDFGGSFLRRAGDGSSGEASGESREVILLRCQGAAGGSPIAKIPQITCCITLSISKINRTTVYHRGETCGWIFGNHNKVHLSLGSIKSRIAYF